MHSLEPEFLEALSFNADHLATLRALGEYRGKQSLFFHQAPETLKTLRQAAVIESTESSNRLEGVTVAPARLEPLLLKRTDPRNRSEQEITGYRDALALIHESGREMALTPNVVLQLHGLLYRYMPQRGGRWKNTQNEITETRPDGTTRVRFEPTPPHLVSTQMDQLAERYAEAVDAARQDPLVLIPLAVFDFLCIHPFNDGNGRVARLITLMLLYHFGYEVGRYISLERIVEATKEGYYDTLEASSQGWHDGRHDVMPWLEYFWGTLLRAYREFGAVCAGGKNRAGPPGRIPPQPALRHFGNRGRVRRRQPRYGAPCAAPDARGRPARSRRPRPRRQMATRQNVGRGYVPDEPNSETPPEQGNGKRENRR